MSVPAPRPIDWTPERVRLLPDDGHRYELVAGQLLVTPAPQPAHQRVLMALIERLLPYVKQSGAGELLTSPADISLDAESIVQPDLFVLPPGERRSRDWADVGTLRLAVEIISPASARHDRGVKRDHYQRHGVPEYWVVDPDARLVERWRPGDDHPEVARGSLAWAPAAGIPPLVVDLRALFADALD